MIVIIIGYYGHHDVYLKPDGNLDPYLNFRSKRHSIHYKLEVECFDSLKKSPVEVNLRLDVLLVIVQSFKSLFQRKASDESPKSPLNNPAETTYESELDSNESSQIEFFDIINNFDSDFILNEFIAVSWASKHDTIGVVVSQQNFHVFFIHLLLNKICIYF